ncbi:MAG: tetratricopeptide repeat protein [Spirulina sp. SIO3F2]|nr:tetratricopeptide repeat protein [Spirulina sp. SIO3F2]
MVWQQGLAAGVAVLLTSAPMGWVKANKTPTEIAEAIAEQNVQLESASAAERHQAALERYRMGEKSAGRAQLEQALELYRAEGDRLGEAMVLLDLSEFSLFHRRSNKTLTLAQESLRLAQAIENSEIAAHAWARIGDYYLWKAEPSEAQDAYQQSLEIAQAAGDRLGEGRALVGLSILDPLGEHTAQQGLALLAEAGTPRDEAFAWLNLFFPYRDQRDAPEAFDLLKLSLAKFQAAGDRALFRDVLESISWFPYDREDGWQIVQTELEERLAIAQATNAPLFELDLLLYLGASAQEEEDAAAAIAYFQQALSLAQEIQDFENALFSLWQLGQIYKVQGNLAEARSYYEQALALAQETNDVQLIISGLRSLGRFYKEQEDFTQARDYYEQAFLLARDAGERERANSLLSDIGRLGWFGGGHRELLEALAYFQAWIPEFLAAGDIESIVVSAEAIAWRVHDAAPEVRKYLQQSLEIARSQGQPEQVARLLEHLGRLHREQSQFEFAANHYNEALAIYQKAQNWEKVVDVLTRLAGIYGDHFAPLNAQQAIDFYQQALRIHQEHDVQSSDLSREVNILENIARLYQQQENFTEALRYYQQQIELYESEKYESVWDVSSSVASVLSRIAELYVAQGNDETAIDYYYQAIEREQQSDESDRHRSIAYKLGKIVELELKRDNLEAVLNVYEKQLTALQAQGDDQALADFFEGVQSIQQQQNSSPPSAQSQPEQFAKAMVKLYQRGLEILGPEGEPKAIVQLLSGLGEAYEQQEQYELALDVYQRKLTVHKQPELQEEWHNQRDLSHALGNIASIYRKQGNIEAAIEYRQRQVEHQRNNPQVISTDLMYSLDQLRFIHLERGDFAAAIAVYQNELEFAQTRETPYFYAELLGKIAHLYRSRRDYDQALDYFQQQLAVQQNYEEQNQHSQLYTLTEIAKLQAEKGDLTAALATFQQRLTVARQVGQLSFIVQSLRHLGNFYLWQEQYPEALSTYEEHQRVAQDWGEPRYVVQSLTLLGLAHHQLKNYDQAIDNYQQQLDIFRAMGDEYSAADTLRSIGEVYQSQRDYAQALKYYQDYLATYQQQPSNWGLFDAFSVLGSFYQEIAEYDQALSYYQQGYDVAQAQERDYAQVRSLGQFAGLFEAQGDLPKAVDYYRQAIAASEAIRAELRVKYTYDPTPEQNLNERFEDIYQNFARVLRQQGRPEEAEAVLELLVFPEIE